MASSPSLLPPPRGFAAPSVRDKLIVTGVGTVGLASAALVWWALADIPFAALFLAVFLAAAGIAILFVQLRRGNPQALPATDWVLIHGAIEESDAAVAITDRSGRLVCANNRYDSWFEGLPTPPGLPLWENRW